MIPVHFEISVFFEILFFLKSEKIKIKFGNNFFENYKFFIMIAINYLI